MTWEQAWKEKRTPWDAGEAAPALSETLALGKALGFGPPGRAFVPGCGRGYDVFELARVGYDALGLDVARAAEAAFEEARAEAGVTARIAIGDFFAYAPEPFDLVWDYTFLCALDPAQRPAWAERSAANVARGGVLCALLFPIDPVKEGGPPFPLDPEEVEALLAPSFERLHLEAPTRSHSGREGNERLGIWRRR